CVTVGDKMMRSADVSVSGFSPCRASQLLRDVAAATGGTQARPDCSQADITTFCQCSRRFSARSPESLTTLRWLVTGWIALTPSSTAFWIVKSIRSPDEMACSSVIFSADSALLLPIDFILALTVLLPAMVSVHT